MKKHLFIMLSIISMHAYAMEMEVKSTDPIIALFTYPTEILDLIAQFLPFHDFETEEEFIARTQAITTKILPKEYLLELPFPKIRCVTYSSDNAIIALSPEDNMDIFGIVLNINNNLTIINRKNNQRQVHTINRSRYKLAVSCDENLVATLYLTRNRDQSTEKMIYQYALCITNFSTDKKKFHDIPPFFPLYDDHPCIAFNKQGTNIIAHAKDSQHIIFPLTINTPNPNADHQKTLAKYFAQRGICKNLTEQIPHMKYLNNK